MSVTPTDRLRPHIAVRFGGATHTGRVRPGNEDAFLARDPIFVVADGMGGHERGREAAARVVAAYDRAITGHWATTHDLELATRAATDDVRRLAGAGGVEPGSTVTGIAMFDHDGHPSWLVFNIGDSRTYRIHAGRIEQITVDHSGRQALMDAGLSQAEANARVPANVITRAIGGGMVVAAELDQWVVPARPGERLVLCSDGLSGEIPDDTLLAICLRHPDPQSAADALVTAALDAGGRDNITVIVVDTGPVYPPPAPALDEPTLGGGFRGLAEDTVETTYRTR